jgi:Gram-negative bacterial TonB protein C-terminal
VIEALQIEESIEVHDAPRLLVQWSSRWREFVTAIRPALARSEARLAGETPYKVLPYWGMSASMLTEALFIFAWIVLPKEVGRLRPYVAPRLSSHDVIYYSGDELPRTEDLAGAQAGAKGRAGGDEAYHRTQTIKIARGGSLESKIVDAPDLKLPSSHDAVANLLAIKPNPGPPPAEGLRSSRVTLTLPLPIVAPAPNVTRDYTRNGVHLDTVIAPSPTPARDPFRAAPNLSATVIPPAPGVQNDHALVAPSLAPNVIRPAPSVSRDRASVAPTLNPTVVAPVPTVSSDNSRSAQGLAANVIPPAPGAISREVTRAPVQMASPAVVPPPASAPERASTRDPKLSLPAPSVVAPPPSTDLSQDMRRLASGSVQDQTKTIVPPPPTQSGSGSFMSSLVNKIFGPSEVVPPPPSVAANSSADPHGNRAGVGSSLGSNVVAPPPSAGISGGSGNRPASASTAPALGMPSVVPPPPSVAAAGGGTGDTGGGKGAPGGTLLASNVVPPPPSVGAGANSAGTGSGRRGAGFGAPMEVGAPSVQPSSGGSGTNAGAVISSQPGSKVGLPTTGGKGSLALSPTGSDKPGLGGSGGGTSIAHGTGSGSGTNGDGSGAAKNNAGHGSDPNARSGTSLNPGPGGTGNAPAGNPPVPGVTVEGGSSIVTLPSFGSGGSGNNDPPPPRSATKSNQQFGVTVVATATSGGAFEPYKSLFHGEIYTTYFDTSNGTVVVEFSDGGSTSRGTITAPAVVRIDLPDGLPHARMVVACTLDAAGNVKNARVLEPGPAAMTAKVMAALRSWKLQPTMRGDQPVEVTAILGFGIDTNDRF